MFERNLAFIIGINNYQNGISPLKTAVNDAKKLVETLREKHNYQVWVCLNEIATLNNLNKLLEKTLPEQVTEDDRLLFYFAGHGVALNGDDGPAGYLIPQDAKQGDTNSYLPMTRLHDALSQLPCRHFLGILDCCFAGAFRWSSTRDLLTAPEIIHKERYDRFITDSAWQIITSSASDQKALDNFKLDTERGQIGNNSPFAAALLEALEGAADIYPPPKPGKSGGDGVITATELYLYLRDRVEIPTEKYRLRQTPGIWCLNKHDKGEYIFLSPGHELNLPPAPPLDESQNPYRGLKSFDEEHSELFFGRSELVEKLQEFVKIHPLTVVLGASGSGKSSLVKAGLIPNKKKQTKEETTDKWSVLSPIRPGETPFQALNNALSEAKLPKVELQNKQKNLSESVAVWAKNNPNSKLLIVIDQSEELITLCQNENERKEFFQQILTAINHHRHQLRVVLTLRSDFEPQVRDAGLKFVCEELKLGNTFLQRRWQSGRFIVPAMTRIELREAIEKPAETRVMYFEPHELVEELIDEVDNMPGALPLLSFALSELFLKYLKRQREAQYSGITIDRSLTEEDYQELGGVMQSLTQRADEEYQKLVEKNPAYEQVIRHVMLRMVALTGGELARRRVPLSELKYSEEKKNLADEVIKRFSTARLLVEGQDNQNQPYVEPAHDALVRGWEKLRNWLEEEKNLELQRRLTPAAFEWDKQQQPRYLWNANPYLDVLNKEVLNSTENNWLNELEAEFVRLSINRRKRNSRMRWGIAASVIVGSVIFSATIWLQLQRTQLRQKAAEAENLLSSVPLEGLVLAIQTTGENLALSKLPFENILNPVQSSLINAVQVAREQNVLNGHSGKVSAVAFSPDGKYIISASWDNTLRLWDREGNSIGKPFTGDRHRIGDRYRIGDRHNINAVKFSPNSKYIVSASMDGTVRLWNLKGQQIGKPFKGHESSVNSVTFYPTGKYIISYGSDNILRWWNLEGQQIVKAIPLKGLKSGATTTAFSPNGRYIISKINEDDLQLWDTTNGQPIGKPFKGHEHRILSVAFSPDNQYIVSGSADNTVRLWNLEGEQQGEQWRPNVHDPDKPNTAKPIGQHQSAVNSVAFSPEPDCNFIISGGADNTLGLWNIENKYHPQQIGEFFQGHENQLNSVAFSPDCKYIVSGGNDNAVRLWHWNKEGKFIYRSFKGHRDFVTSVAFSPDGNFIVSGSSDNKVILWNLEHPKKRKTLLGHKDEVTSVAFSPNGNYIASGSKDKTVRLWDSGGELIEAPFKGHDMEVTSVAFSPDGKYIASASRDGKVQLWNIKGKQIGKAFQAHEHGVSSIAFSPDSKYIVTGSSSGGVLEGTGVDNNSNVLKLWNLKGENIGEPFRGHKHSVTSIAFSPDGNFIISGSKDNTIRFWNREGNPVATLSQAHNGYVSSVGFSPDGKYIVSGGGKTVRLWPGSQLQPWLETACERLRSHPILVKAETEVAKGAKETCQKYVWKNTKILD